MAPESFTHFVFIDFENVTKIDLTTVEGKAVHVTLLIGRNQRRLELPLVRQIHRLAAQVELVEVGASGHNALDLTLAFYLGQAVQRTPQAHFCIVSRDRDFEPMIQHAQGERVDVARYDAFEALPFLVTHRTPPAGTAPTATRAAAPTRSLEQRRTRVMARLKDPSYPNRPATRSGLIAHIKTTLGKESSDEVVDAIVHELLAGRHLSVGPDDKVIYPENQKRERSSRSRSAPPDR